MATVHELFVNQIIGLGWIRCCMEEGVSFINKQTGETETRENVIYENFEQQTGLFDMPKANVSPSGLEKNILEVAGSYIILGESQELMRLLLTSEVRKLLRSKIEAIRIRDRELNKTA